MIMKNKNSIRYWVLVIGYWLLVNHLPFTIYHLPNSAAAVGQKSTLSSLTILPDPNSNLRHQLWRAELSIAKGEKDKRTKDKLKRMIEQIRSIELKPDKQDSEPVLVPDVVQAVETNETLPDTAVSKEQKTKEIEPKLPYEPISDKTLQILRNLSQHPDKLDNPFEMGETLVLSGNLKEAVIFYQEALKRKSSHDVSSVQDRAWILFQIGNCLWNDDPPTAMKMYGQLITEYPNSPWKGLAKARSKLLNWYLTDKPSELIAEHKL